LRDEVRAIDRAVPLRIETLTGRIRDSLTTERVVAIVSSVLTAVALLLASTGLYGLMAYAVWRRTNEIGIRMSLGASGQTVLWMILGESLVLAGVGAVTGVAGSLALGRFMAGLLHGVSASDPAALAAATLLMVCVSALAGYVPARRASRLDPAIALRQQ
jgi:putative ABC transport system permease protein